MSGEHSIQAEKWVSLRDASKHLGVSHTTLRAWADNGKVPSFRTPGGHRRFGISAIHSQVTATPSAHPERQLELLIHSALGRARLEITSGHLERESWFRHLSPSAKKQHSQLGRRLMALLLQVLRDEKAKASLMRQARNIGKEYARVNIQQGTSVVDALRAFLFFRDYLIEEMIELSGETREQIGTDTLQTYRRLSRFVNEMLVTMVETCSMEKRHK